MNTFVAGTRGSELALWQTRHVASRLAALAQVELKIITTRGDVDQRERLQGKLEKGFFTEELEAELRDKTIDWAVHSLKDLPTRSPAGLTIGATLRRAPPGDLLVVRPDKVQDRGPKLLPLPDGAVVGSSSLRRESLLRYHMPQCRTEPLRGNVPTRAERLRQGKYDAILLAHAGVARLELNLKDLAVYELNPRRWPGAPGQGAVAVQCREGDERVLEVLRTLDDAPTRRATHLEREFLKTLEGGCTTPFGCYVDGDRLWIGQAVEGGWKRLAAKVPPGDVPQAWIDETLKQLSSQQLNEVGDDSEWLHRRV